MKKQVSASRAGDKIQALHDKIEDLRTSGKTILEAAKAVGLAGQSIAAVDAAGKDPKGAPVNLPDKPELLRAAFASDVGLDEAALNTKDGGYVWFEVTKIDPAHDLTFDEAKPEVEKQWRAEEVDKALAGKADDLVKQISAGGTIAAAAKSAGAEVKTATDIHRAERGSLPESVVAAIFRQPADGAGSAATPDGRTVFKITADRAAGRLRRRPRQGDGHGARYRNPRKPARSICRRAAPGVGVPSIRTSSNPRRAVETSMTTLPDYEAFARAYIAGEAEVAVTTLVADLETPVSAYLKLARGRAGNMFLLEFG